MDLLAEIYKRQGNKAAEMETLEANVNAWIAKVKKRSERP